MQNLLQLEVSTCNSILNIYLWQNKFACHNAIQYYTIDWIEYSRMQDIIIIVLRPLPCWHGLDDELQDRTIQFNEIQSNILRSNELKNGKYKCIK